MIWEYSVSFTEVYCTAIYSAAYNILQQICIAGSCALGNCRIASSLLRDFWLQLEWAEQYHSKAAYSLPEIIFIFPPHRVTLIWVQVKDSYAGPKTYSVHWFIPTLLIATIPHQWSHNMFFHLLACMVLSFVTAKFFAWILKCSSVTRHQSHMWFTKSFSYEVLYKWCINSVRMQPFSMAH